MKITRDCSSRAMGIAQNTKFLTTHLSLQGNLHKRTEFPRKKKCEEINERKKRKWTVIGVNRSSVEDSGIDRAILNVNIDGVANDAHGGEKQGFTEWIRRRWWWRSVILCDWVPVSATHLQFPISFSLEASVSSAVVIEWRDLAIAKTSFVMTKSEHDTQQAYGVVSYTRTRIVTRVICTGLLLYYLIIIYVFIMLSKYILCYKWNIYQVNR